MHQNSPAESTGGFVPVQSGLTNRLFQRLGLLQPASRRALRIVVLILVTWVPLFVLSSLSGHVTGHSVTITLLRDPEVHCRFLIALPLLELAEVFLAISLSVQARQLMTCGVVSDSQKSRFDTILASVRRWHNSTWAEAVLLIVALGLSIVVRLFVMSDAATSWERQGGVVSPAGWWHVLVSLPLLYFFLLRAVWVFLLWAMFLGRIARLDLELTPTHPDRAGGLGFLAWGLVSFAPTVFSFSTVVSAGFAYEIYHRGESLQSLKYHLIVYVILMTILFHLPVLPFSLVLSRCRLNGLLDFGRLVWRHDRAFDEKWIDQPQSRNQEKLLGTPDVQSLASIATAYEHIQQMRLVPIDTKSATVLALAAAIPMLPLIGTEIPFQEILTKLAELLV